MTGYEKVEHASLTDVGVRRSHNQDSHAVLLATDASQWQQCGHVFLVADGMGAHAVGELASELAGNIIPHTYCKHAADGPRAALCKAFVEANASIHSRGQQNREFQGMGTTATVLLLRPEGAWVGHVGDSRAYRIRDGIIEQLSFDHSLVWELARRQGVDPDTLHGIPSNVIVRSLGPEPLVQVDVEGPHPLQEGDTFVLCSDGLSGQLSDSEIGAVASTLEPEEACSFLVNLANLRGGPDNITVCIVRLPEAAPESGIMKRPEAVQPSAWYRRMPWPFTALLLGVLLAGGAAGLAAFHQSLPLVISAFGLGVASLLAGLAGLIFYHRQEQRQGTGPDQTTALNVYSRTSCQIDRNFVDKVAKAATNLQKRLKDKNLEVDWGAFAFHQSSGDANVKNGDLIAAFREYCRAVHFLTDALHRTRNKEEMFQPVWDRTRN